MGRPRMNCVLPTYASAFTDVRGKERVRLRRTGWKTVYVAIEPGTPEFTAAYRDWEKNGKKVIGEKQVAPGSFDALISRFYRSSDWTNIKPSTQYTYRGELERFRAKFGDRPVNEMTAMHVGNLLEKMHETPSAANNLLKRLRQLFDYAIRIGMVTTNPAKAVKPLKVRTGGFATWQEEQIEQFEARHPIGTTARLAFDLALYTAQRRSDVRVMGPQHVERGRIRVKQMKTGKTLMIPIHTRLAESIAATPTSHLAFLVSQRDTPFTFKSFGMWFMRRCREAGLEGYAMHGLRKAASRRMAEMGLSNQLIKSITGHSSDAEVARYTRDAEQEAMADRAASIMANRGNLGLANNDQDTGTQG